VVVPQVARDQHRELSDFLRLNHLFYRATLQRASIGSVLRYDESSRDFAPPKFADRPRHSRRSFDI
jgi:hypothetical protein